MSEEMLIPNGCLGVGESPNDFILDEGNEWGLPTLYDQDDIYFEYNQNANTWSKLSCTIYNAFGAISDLMNYEFPLEQIKELNDLSYEKGRVKGYGWDTRLAVDMLRNWWNSQKDLVAKYGKVASYRFDMRNDALVNKILDKNYTICWSFQGNTDYILDYYHDAILHGYSFGKKTYGHSVWLRKHNGVKSVKDNYKGRNYNGLDTNFYEMRPTCKEEVDWGTYRLWGYLFTKVREDNYEELMRLEKVQTKCNNALAANSDLWNNTNDKTLQKKLHDVNEYIRQNNLKYIEKHKALLS